jgi:hypothetical protein
MTRRPKMLHYYDKDFDHILEHHSEEIMAEHKERYSDDTFELIESLTRGNMNDATFCEKIKDLIIASAEIVYEDHDQEEEKANDFKETEKCDEEE